MHQFSYADIVGDAVNLARQHEAEPGKHKKAPASVMQQFVHVSPHHCGVRERLT